MYDAVVKDDFYNAARLCMRSSTCGLCVLTRPHRCT
jgi:hypothetical protein